MHIWNLIYKMANSLKIWWQGLKYWQKGSIVAFLFGFSPNAILYPIIQRLYFKNYIFTQLTIFGDYTSWYPIIIGIIWGLFVGFHFALIMSFYFYRYPKSNIYFKILLIIFLIPFLYLVLLSYGLLNVFIIGYF